jgi:putative sterol carrier protein
MSEIENIKTIILRKFISDKSRDLSCEVRIDWRTECVDFRLIDGNLEFTTADEIPKVVIYFESFDRVSKVLSGEIHHIDEFMEGKLRSNGYLIPVLQTLHCFR